MEPTVQPEANSSYLKVPTTATQKYACGHILALTFAFFLILAMPSTCVAQSPSAVRVYLFTAPSEFVDEDVKNRRDTVEDLRRFFEDKRELQLVDHADRADLTVEVLRRAREDADRPRDQKMVSAKVQVHLRLSVRTYATELTGTGQRSFTERRAAAKDAGNQVLKWIRDNHAELVAAR
jgi:hypothetical protein